MVARVVAGLGAVSAVQQAAQLLALLPIQPGGGRHPHLQVGITAGADTVTVLGAVVIGLVAGLIVVGSVIFFDKIKIDDPVGAISVHLTCGIWGTLAVGLFSTNPEHSFLTQLIGVAALFALGIALEGLQSFVPGRYPSALDGLANLVGVLIGFGLAALVNRVIANRQTRTG